MVNGGVQCHGMGEQLSKARVLSFCAFCHIDLGQYEDAMRILHEASRLTDNVLTENLTAFQRPDSPSNPESQLAKAELKEDLLYLQRMQWILHYHLALSYYMTKQFALAAEVRPFLLSLACSHMRIFRSGPYWLDISVCLPVVRQ